MESLLFFFLENMALIIALMYLALKVKESFFSTMNEAHRLFWFAALFISFLTFSVMYNPFHFEGMRIDLREVPLYFISFLGGWRLGIVSIIVPSLFRIYLAGPTVVEGILQSILLPVLIGSLFHLKRDFHPFFALINLKRMMTGFVVFEILKSFFLLMSTPISVPIALAMSFFGAIAVIAIGLMLNDANQNLILRKELEFHSNHDGMTNLPNLRFFKNKVQDLVTKKVPIYISMIDVDHFKNYNDINGHPKGDVVLRTIGQLLKESVSKDDYVARYGGEEFIICYADALDPADAEKLAEQFRQTVEDYPFENEATQPNGQLTVSMGMSFSTDVKTLEQVIEEADNALYQSKEQGRNRITVYDAD